MQDGAHGVRQRSVSTFIVDSGWLVVDGWGVGSCVEGSCRGCQRRGWVPVCTGTTVHSGWLGRWELRGGLLSRESTAGMGSRLHGNDDSSWIVGVLGVTRRAPVAGIHGGDGFPSARERRFIVDSWGVGSYAEGSCRGNPRRGWVPVCTGTTVHSGWLGCWELRGGLLSRVSTAGMGSRLHGNDDSSWIVGVLGVTRRASVAGIHGGDGFPSARERRALAHPLDARGSNPEPLDCGNRVPSATSGTPTCTGTTRRREPWRAITGASSRRCRSTG